MSIFSKPTPPPAEKVNEQRFADVELSISKRYSALEKKIDNLFDGLSNRLSKFDEQVNILLKRTYDLEGKVEGQLIDVENTSKKQLHRQLERMEQFEREIAEKFVTIKEHKDISDSIAGTVRGIKTDIDRVGSEGERIDKSIPRNTVSLLSINKLKSELDSKIEKIANALPKNTVSGDTLTSVRLELIDQMQGYATNEALKAVANTTQQNVDTNNKSNQLISDSVTRYKQELGIQAYKLKNIEKDYLDSSFNKSIDSRLTHFTTHLNGLIQDTNKSIPTNFVSESEFNTLLEKQKQLNELVGKNHKSSNDLLNSTDKTITTTMDKSITKINKDIKKLKQTIIESKLGEDVSGLKLMVRELVDEVVKDIKNTNDFALGSFKTENIERKKDISDVNQIVNGLRKDMNKTISIIKHIK